MMWLNSLWVMCLLGTLDCTLCQLVCAFAVGEFAVLLVRLVGELIGTFARVVTDSVDVKMEGGVEFDACEGARVRETG